MNKQQFYCAIFAMAVICFSDTVLSNTNDTLYFSASFGYFGLLTKNIEVIDKTTGNKAIITKYHSRYLVPVPLIISNESDTLVITINERFRRKPTKLLLKVQDVEARYIRIWRNEDKEFLFSYDDHKVGKF